MVRPHTLHRSAKSNPIASNVSGAGNVKRVRPAAPGPVAPPLAPRALHRAVGGSATAMLLLVGAWLLHMPEAGVAIPALSETRASASEGAQRTNLPRASEVVEARAYVSLAPVPRGRAFDLAVVAQIRSGFHINAHKPTETYLIPTTLEAELPPGFRRLETIYPRGVLRKFEFSPTKLSVYEGSATLRMKLQAPPEAPLGAHQLALTLSYQACNDEACLPPAKLPVIADLEIAPAGAPARLVYSSIFRTPPRPKTSSPR